MGFEQITLRRRSPPYVFCQPFAVAPVVESPFQWEQQLHSPCRRVLDPTSFPEQDLMNSLLNLYFDHVNLFMPLLHRPTFNAGLIVDMHLVDTSFARVVLLVCAIGARFSEDPRVLCTGSQSPLSAGWKWYNQAQSLEETLLAPASLYNIQSCCVSQLGYPSS